MRPLIGTAILIGFIFSSTAISVEKRLNLNGTWLLDRSKSDSGRRPRQPRSSGGGIPGIGGGLPRGGRGGIGFPRGGRGGFPGGYPGTYPGGTPGGGRPGGGNPGSRGSRPEAGADRQNLDLTLVIKQTEREVQMTRRYDGADDGQSIQQTFALDGSESKNPSSIGRGEFVSRSTLDKKKLVNLGVQRISSADGKVEVTINEEYSLSGDGKTLTMKRSRITRSGKITTKQVFIKTTGQPPPSAREASLRRKPHTVHEQALISPWSIHIDLSRARVSRALTPLERRGTVIVVICAQDLTPPYEQRS